MTTRTRVLRYLNWEEPEYKKAASVLGPKALPHLADLAGTADPLLASKATHLASLIHAPGARAVVEAAAAREEPEVRVAAAAAVPNLWAPEMAEAAVAHAPGGVLDRLLEDPDLGVRKYALKAALQLNLDDRVDDAVLPDSTPPFLREMVEKERRRRP